MERKGKIECFSFSSKSINIFLPPPANYRPTSKPVFHTRVFVSLIAFDFVFINIQVDLEILFDMLELILREQV